MNSSANRDRVRVLVVDDDAKFLQSAAAILEDSFDVVVEASPANALALHEREPFDVVCADLSMPEMNGLDLLATVAARTPATGRLLLTGTRDAVKRIPIAKAPEFLLKPFEPTALVQTIERISKVARMRRATQAMAARAEATGKAR